ncbi:MAG: hypothetical protein ACO1NU_05325 [Arcticibacter sp.]
MGRLLAIWFLSVYLISTTELVEFLKFPVLIGHYISHKEKNPDISIVRFLAIHYEGNHLENHPEDEDYQEDQRLPFIFHSHVLSLSFVLIPPFHFETEADYPVRKESEALPWDDTFSYCNYFSTIWQPPKGC